MTSSHTDRFRRLLVALLLAAAPAAMLLALVMAVGTKPAKASFPGENGKIVFASERKRARALTTPQAITRSSR
jgi:hypothetical protein